MEKVEKNLTALQQFIDQLKNKKLKRNGDTEFYAKVNFNCEGISKEDTIRVHILTGHHAGKIQLIDENETFKNVFVRFIANSQDYKLTENGTFIITDTSGKSQLGNYEVIIREM